MLFSDDEKFAGVNGPNVHEGHDLAIFVRDTGFGGALDYPAEDACRI